MRPLAAIAVVFAVAGLAGGCDWARGVGAKVNLDSVGLADRCADIMKRAAPFTDIELGQRTSENTGLRTMVARVEGTRDLPKDAPGERDLAAECQFEDGILTSFRWTKGGPAPEK
jgi:hypothetical protein